MCRKSRASNEGKSMREHRQTCSSNSKYKRNCIFNKLKRRLEIKRRQMVIPFRSEIFTLWQQFLRNIVLNKSIFHRFTIFIWRLVLNKWRMSQNVYARTLNDIVRFHCVSKMKRILINIGFAFTRDACTCFGHPTFSLYAAFVLTFIRKYAKSTIWTCYG